MAESGAPELLRTKLHIPRPRAGLVDRDRLLNVLERASAGPLTLISAPAGFGKTSIVASWLARRHAPAGWLSLDPDDDEPARFWRYVVEALRVVVPDFGRDVVELLESGLRPAEKTLAGAIINELSLSEERVVCVLDDFHCIASRPLSDAVLFLVTHAPSALHLVITSRADPPWPLARLRADAQVTEIRATDLRFDEREARMLLEGSGLHLEERSLRMLEARTEGWVAGLWMAALSMHGHVDPDGFAADFAGSHRFVLDYLTEEVLSRQPPDVLRFLEQTSILGRLCGGLSDAVTGEADGAIQLQRLVRDNMFIEPLDDERRWYRYHPLLSDVLRSRSRAQLGEPLAELHRRACAWFEENRLYDEAIHHAFEAGDQRSAARLIGHVASATFMVSEQLQILRWLDRLSEEVISTEPQVALLRAWSRFVLGEMDGIEGAVEVAGTSIRASASGAVRPGLEAQLDAIRAWIAYQRGALEDCIELARRALAGLPADGLVPARTVTLALGSALVLVGELDAAHDALEKARTQSRIARDRLSESLSLAVLCSLELERGRPAVARTRALDAIARGTVAGEPLPPVGIAQVLLGEAHREIAELADAERVLVSGISMCEVAMGLPEWVFEGNVTLARVVLARGDRLRAASLASRADEILESVIVPGGMEPLVRRALEYRNSLGAALAALAPAARASGGLVEPLSDRELELLRLLAARRSNREIADELYLSVNTVKWHARNVYGKLGVASRTEAVKRARELGIS